MTVRCGYADISRGQIHYRQSGTGASLLLLHQAPRSSRVFVPLLETLKGFGNIAPDLPGFGASCELPEGSTIESIAGLLVEFLDAMDIPSTHVFGLHSGNKVAAALAHNWPDRVDRLIIAGMRHSLIPDANERNEAMARYVAGKRPLRREDDPQAYDEEELDKLACSRAYKKLYEANYSFDLAGALAQSRAPTLILELAVPEEESLGSPGQALAGRMPHAHVEHFNGNDRELMNHRPRELAQILDSFCLASV